MSNHYLDKFKKQIDKDIFFGFTIIFIIIITIIFGIGLASIAPEVKDSFSFAATFISLLTFLILIDTLIYLNYKKRIKINYLNNLKKNNEHLIIFNSNKRSENIGEYLIDSEKFEKTSKEKYYIEGFITENGYNITLEIDKSIYDKLDSNLDITSINLDVVKSDFKNII